MDLTHLAAKTTLSEEDYMRCIRCTLCAACARVCPGGLRVDELLLQARQGLAGQGLLPPGLARLGRALEESHNLSGEGNGRRLIWAENSLGIENALGATGAPGTGYPFPAPDAERPVDAVYFVGCVGSFFPRSYALPRATVRLLDAAGLAYALLGSEEWCCGFPLLANGRPEAARQAMAHNVERVRALGARRVVFTCPPCYHMWRDEYPCRLGADLDGLEVQHISELLAELIEAGRLPLRPSLRLLEGVVTYHDPGDLGRKSGVFDAPRRVLRAIPGLKLVERRDARAQALCCGGGVIKKGCPPWAGRRLLRPKTTGLAMTVLESLCNAKGTQIENLICVPLC